LEMRAMRLVSYILLRCQRNDTKHQERRVETDREERGSVRYPLVTPLGFRIPAMTDAR
jgi:hypothetical protein